MYAVTRGGAVVPFSSYAQGMSSLLGVDVNKPKKEKNMSKKNELSKAMKRVIKAYNKADGDLFNVHLYESPIGDVHSRVDELVEKYTELLKAGKTKKLAKLLKKIEKAHGRLEKAVEKEHTLMAKMSESLRDVLQQMSEDIHQLSLSQEKK